MNSKDFAFCLNLYLMHHGIYGLQQNDIFYLQGEIDNSRILINCFRQVVYCCSCPGGWVHWTNFQHVLKFIQSKI